MKKFIYALIATVAMSCFIWGLVSAGDDTYRPGWYDDKGFTLSEMLIQGIDSSTVSGYQLKRRVMTVPVTMASAGEDTVWTQLFSVPDGQTITVTEINLAAHTEVAGNNDSAWSSILYYTGSTTSALDTAVAQFPTDADSAAYADTILTLPMTDSVFTAGDIVTFWQMNLEGAATGGEGAAVTIEYLLDE